MRSLKNYYGDIAHTLRSHFSALSMIQHTLSQGIQNEEILREFLTRYIPKWFTVATGFVLPHADFDNKVEFSRQLDVIIYDSTRYAPTYSVGNFVLVREEAVAGVIEVKTTLRHTELGQALENIASTKSITPAIYGYIFAFKGKVGDTSIKNRLEAAKRNYPVSHLPNAICMLDGQFIKREGTTMLKAEANSDQLALFYYKLLFDLASWADQTDVAEIYREIVPQRYETIFEF